MAGLVPVIHVLVGSQKFVDARHKAGHDEEFVGSAYRMNFDRSAFLARSPIWLRT
jgi:hypothetical protein